jgi:IS1 family transposase
MRQYRVNVSVKLNFVLAMESCYSWGMNKLPLETRVQILSMLCKGSSMRLISRVTGVSINTVTKLLVDAGLACAAFHDATVRGVAAQRVQCDEIWSFSYAKAKNVEFAKSATEGAGDVWTWAGLDADSKLIVSWHVGDRSYHTGTAFMGDLKARLADRVQLTADGHRAYLSAVKEVDFDADYAMLVKIFATDIPPGPGRYSPPQYIGATKQAIMGNPDPKHISTSFVERQNLSMRMSMRRFTRLTNAFSKKFENHRHALALYFYFYNFCRVHKTLGATPAMAAGLVDRVLKIQDVVAMIDAANMPGQRGPYKRRAVANSGDNFENSN